jgi:putative tryptophan/tyrosine transport system substrate-binding protein
MTQSGHLALPDRPVELVRYCFLSIGGMMRRRVFLGLLSAAAALWPVALYAQQTKIVRIGALYLGNADAESFKANLREGLRELGYVEGQNIAFEFRSAEGKADQLPLLAGELVRLKVDVIVALYVPCALAAKQATTDIPIVAIAADPVETGIVPSLARPGGNITGVSLMSAASNAKNIELFRDMLPTIRRVAVLVNAKDPIFAKAMIDEALRAGTSTGTEIGPVLTINGPDELESAFAAMVKEQAGAVIVQGSLVVKALTDMAIKYRLPAASSTRAFSDIGGLMSFGADGPAAVRHGAKFVQRILQGKGPKDIPVEQPTKYELAINLIQDCKGAGPEHPRLGGRVAEEPRQGPLLGVNPNRGGSLRPNRFAFGGATRGLQKSR